MENGAFGQYFLDLSPDSCHGYVIDVSITSRLVGHFQRRLATQIYGMSTRDKGPKIAEIVLVDSISRIGISMVTLG